MKATCDREALREGLGIVCTIIPVKSTQPILENVYIVASDTYIELVGTDQEVSVRLRIDKCEVHEPGPIVIDARTAYEFTKDLSGETILLETSDTKCTLISGIDSCDLMIADVGEYPDVAHFEPEGAVDIQAGSFTKLVGQTAFAAAREAGRYAMHGILTELTGDQLRMVATDGRRLSMSTIPVDMKGIGDQRAIVPTKGMQLFCRVISDPLDQIKLSVREDRVSVHTKNSEVTVRLIDGDFPNYNAVVPAECGNLLEADTNSLSQKLRLVSNVSGDEVRAVKLTVQGDQLQLYGKDDGRGTATAHMDVKFSGDDDGIAFNPDYVIDGLKVASHERVKLEFANRKSPGKFTLGDNHIYVVMPITVNT